jgi:hypothetical protein
MIPGNANPLLLTQAAGGGYEIERSLRFNSSDSAYLGATFGTPTNQDIFTLSMWAKRSALGSTQHLFGVSTNHSFGFTSGDALNLTFGGSSALTTTALFRDPSAWYHIMWVQNGTAHTLYVNGASVGTATATSSTFNTAVAHQIGAGNTANFFNGYLADIHFIDGQALAPSSFGDFDTNGVWQPKAYTGSYGTNGFHLPFSDNSTAAALGTDTSGNGNTWTVNNISVAAGAGNDSLVDSPTNGSQEDTGAGGEVRGNYATLNPLSKGSAVTLSDGNLQHYSTDSSWSGPSVALCGFGMTSGKWYWECTISTTTFSYIGMAQIDKTHSYIGGNANSCGYLTSNGLYYGGGAQAPGGVPYTANATLMFAYDADAKKFWVGQNGTWFSTGGNAGDPANGNYPSHSGFGSSGEVYTPATSTYGTVTTRYNFGQRPFAYTAPSGFKALCTTNLAEGTITTSGTFTGNALANGPFVYLNGVPTAMTINGNAVTFATHADKLSNGFKVRTSSGSYNTAGSNTYSINTTGDKFKYARAQSNP